MSICISCKKNDNGICKKLGINALGMNLIDICIDYRREKKFISKEPTLTIKSYEGLEEKYKYSDIIITRFDIENIIEWFETLNYEILKFPLNEGTLRYSLNDIEYLAHFRNDSGDCVIELWEKKYHQEFIFLLKSLVKFNENGYEIIPIKYVNKTIPNLKWKDDFLSIEVYSKMVLAQLYYIDEINRNKDIIVRAKRNSDNNFKSVTNTHIYEVTSYTICISDKKYVYVNGYNNHSTRKFKRKADSWNVMGHYRHYKNGKIVFIKSFTKGQGIKTNHKYRISR